MNVITMTILAIGVSATINAARAAETPTMEVIVVTAKRADPPESSGQLSVQVTAPSIDFARLAIEPPKLDFPETTDAPKRIELAAGSDAHSKT